MRSVNSGEGGKCCFLGDVWESFDVMLEIDGKKVFLLLVPNASTPGISFILTIQVLSQDRPPELCLNTCRHERVKRYL